MKKEIDINAYTDDTSIDTVINSVVGGGRSRQLIAHVHPLTNRVQYTVKECLYFDTFQEAVKSYNEAEADYKIRWGEKNEMTNKITLDPALVRAVLGIKYEIDIHYDEDFGVIEYGKKDDCNDGVSIDIHRFKDLAIEWCAGKGWVIRPEINWIYPDKGKVEIFEKGYIREQIRWGKECPTRLSAELAAISFVWEQIQKEKKDENQ